MPAPPQWTFVLTDLNGAVLGELIGATQRTLTLPLNRVPTVSFQLPLWHPLGDTVLTQDALVKVYRRDVLGTQRLVFCGPLTDSEENGDALNQSIAATASGPFVRLTNGRFIGTTKAGIRFPSSGTADLGAVAGQILTTANGSGYTGIEVGTVTGAASIADGSVGPYWLKNAGEAIAELASGLNTFDWEIAPTEPTNVGKAWPQIGAMNIYSLLGAQKPNAILEYGTPRANVTGYNRKVARTYANHVIVPTSGWPDGTALDLIVRTDATSITNRGLWQVVVNDGGVIDDTLRQSIGDEHLKYRKDPHQIVTFTPAVNARPAIFTDYIVGDWIRARAVVRSSVRFDSMFRIWGATFTLDQNGNESLDLQLVQE